MRSTFFLHSKSVLLYDHVRREGTGTGFGRSFPPRHSAARRRAVCTVQVGPREGRLYRRTPMLKGAVLAKWRPLVAVVSWLHRRLTLDFREVLAVGSCLLCSWLQLVVFKFLISCLSLGLPVTAFKTCFVCYCCRFRSIITLSYVAR